MATDRNLTEDQASERTGLSARSLQRDRIDGLLGLPYTRIGARRIVYSEQAILAWLASRTFTSRAGELAGVAKP